jgi:uncharacterized protein (DUF1015 family)
MAAIHPFRALRYTSAAGPIDTLATLPYDVIPAELEAEYKALSPYNFAHLILPKGDYAGAAEKLKAWKRSGILSRDDGEAMFVYEQSFTAPGASGRLTRRGLVALGDTEDYGKTVFRHEWTLAGPREDRFRLLEATGVQFDSIFMLYDDAGGALENLLAGVTAAAPDAAYSDHQGTDHRLWRVADPAWIGRAQQALAAGKLLIADGHHRYETGLRMGQRRTLMTLVAMDSPGLRCYATHRLVGGLEGFGSERLLQGLASIGDCRRLESLELASPAGRMRIVAALPDGLWAVDLETAPGALNVAVLQERILNGILGLTPERIAAGGLKYRRSLDEALAEVREGRAQVAFLLEDLPVDGVAKVSFAGQVLPQKSTYFYPKLGSGLVMYEID